ncbi:MAG: DUF6516 family protein [Pseudomonadota bacterium]
MVYKHKAELKSRYIIELVLHDVGKSKKYPDGLKYSLICFDKKTKMKILMDNHHPKGHHIHIGKNEIRYNFKNSDKLFNDFKIIVFENLGVKI